MNLYHNDLRQLNLLNAEGHLRQKLPQNFLKTKTFQK